MENSAAIAHVKEWTELFLSKGHSSLGNFPPCPFARRAILDNKVLWSVCPGKAELNRLLEEAVASIENGGREVGLVIYERFEDWSLDELDRFVLRWRREFEKRDMYLMRDHPKRAELVNGVSMNNGKYLLFFVQRLSALQAAREQLRQQGYYDVWAQKDIQLVHGALEII